MATTTDNERDNRPTSELIRDLSEQSTRLIHQVIALARAELSHKSREAGFGIGLFGAGRILSAYGLGAVTASGILLLCTAMNA